MSHDKSHEEVSLLMERWDGITEAGDPRAVFAFNITRCRLVRWNEVVRTPTGLMASLAVILEGFVEGQGKRARLYLVEPEDVAPFDEALCNVVGGTIVTAVVPIALRPLAMLDAVDPDGSRVSVLLGRRPNATVLLKALGEFEPTR